MLSQCSTSDVQGGKKSPKKFWFCQRWLWLFLFKCALTWLCRNSQLCFLKDANVLHLNWNVNWYSEGWARSQLHRRFCLIRAVAALPNNWRLSYYMTITVRYYYFCLVFCWVKSELFSYKWPYTVIEVNFICWQSADQQKKKKKNYLWVDEARFRIC